MTGKNGPRVRNGQCSGRDAGRGLELDNHQIERGKQQPDMTWGVGGGACGFGRGGKDRWKRRRGSLRKNGDLPNEKARVGEGGYGGDGAEIGREGLSRTRKLLCEI